MNQPNISTDAKSVVVLEKDSRFLAEIRKALESDPGLIVTAERTDLHEAASLLTEEIKAPPNLIIVSLDLLKEAVASDAERLMGLKEKMAGTKLVITSERYADEEIFRMIQEGIRGFFIKGTPAQLITKCIGVVLDGGMWMDNASIARVFEEVSRFNNKGL